jgi:hypothetical protein
MDILNGKKKITLLVQGHKVLQQQLTDILHPLKMRLILPHFKDQDVGLLKCPNDHHHLYRAELSLLNLN